MLMKLRPSKARGIGLLELMLSLAIIAVLLVMATRYYKTARQGQQVNDAIAQVEAIVGASAHYSIGHDDYSKISIQALIEEGLLPKGSDLDPWHGQVTVSSGGNPNQITISMRDMPLSACWSLSEKLNKQTARPKEDPRSMCSSTDPAVFSGDFE